MDKETTFKWIMVGLLNQERKRLNKARSDAGMRKIISDPVLYEKYLARMRKHNAKHNKQRMADPDKAAKQRERKKLLGRKRQQQRNQDLELRAKFLARKRERSKVLYEQNKSCLGFAEKRSKWAASYTKSPKGRASAAKRHKKMWATSPEYRLAFNSRSRIRIALHGNDKHGHMLDLVGCSMEELKRHLDKQFADGMCWSNYGRGKGKWSIDHIKPCASFDLSDKAQQRAAFHYTNLQPLWYEINSSKNSVFNGVKFYYHRTGVEQHSSAQ